MCDLYNPDGKFLSYEQFLEMNIKTNFIEYCGIKKVVTSRTKHIALFDKALGPHIPSSIRIFLKNGKECKDMYQLLVYNSKTTITAVKKWQANGNIFSEETWSSIFELPFKVTQETKLRWLQFQILHRIVPTNEYLFKLNIFNSSSHVLFARTI